MSTVINFIQSGGTFMYIILGISVLAIAIILERYFTLSMSYQYDEGFFKGILRTLRGGNAQQAILLCKETGHPLAKTLGAVLNYHSAPAEARESAAGVAFQKLTAKLQKRTNYLSLFGNVATLVGLLGTIQGLIMSFSSLAGASGAEKAELLAQGISTAMNTTAFGLIVAIPCLIAHHMLSNKENALLDKYEETLNEALHVMEHSPAMRRPMGHQQQQQLNA